MSVIASHVATVACLQRAPQAAVVSLYLRTGYKISGRCRYRPDTGQFPAFDVTFQVMSLPMPVQAGMTCVSSSLTGQGSTPSVTEVYQKNM